MHYGYYLEVRTQVWKDVCVCVCTRRRVCPPSPLSALALQRLRPPSSAAWAEFLNASANGKMERDFALLTLTDGEQRELYEAARIIQNAFRRYKVRTYTCIYIILIIK